MKTKMGQLDASVPPESPWRREPSGRRETHVTRGITSPHAQVICDSGRPISITWRKVLPESVQPSDSSDTTKWLEGSFYPKRYVVLAVPPRAQDCYWHCRQQRSSVMIPKSYIQERDCHNQAFPAEVANGPSRKHPFNSSGDNPEIVITKRFGAMAMNSRPSTQQAGCSWNCWETSVGMGGRAVHLGFVDVSAIPFPLTSPLSWDRITPYRPAVTPPITPTCSNKGACDHANQLPMKWDAMSKGMPSKMPLRETQPE